jgi:hypothetical protein
MFGFGSNDYAPRSDYMRAIAEEQAARQQQARLRRQQQQQQQQYGRAPFAQPLFGGVDDDYGFEPPSFPGYGAPGGRDRSREARYRAALEEEARLERAERQRAQELFRLRQQEEARARAAAELERRQAYEAAMRERERELQRRRAAAEEAWKARAEMERQRRRQDEIRREEAQRQLRERLGLRTRPEQTARTARSTNAQVGCRPFTLLEPTLMYRRCHTPRLCRTEPEPAPPHRRARRQMSLNLRCTQKLLHVLRRLNTHASIPRSKPRPSRPSKPRCAPAKSEPMPSSLSMGSASRSGS